MIGRIHRLLTREYYHYNFTFWRLFKFSVAYTVVLPVSMGLLWILVDLCGMYYMLAALLSGAVSLLMRFALSAVFAFNRVGYDK